MRASVRSVLLAFLATCTHGLQAQESANDPTFNPPDVGFGQGDGADSYVQTCVLQPDGKALIGGDFFKYNGAFHYRIARLLPNGLPDATFNVGGGADATVYACALQPDGKILIGGDFTTFNGSDRARIARLNADGSVDTGFNPGTGATGTVYAIAVRPDGKIMIGGSFSWYNGTTRVRIARLNSDGSLDTAFDPGTGATNTIRSIALRPDNKILIAGDFIGYNGTARSRIARLTADGSLDTSFDPGSGANAHIRTCVLQSDGRVLIGGLFTTFNGAARNRFTRLNADGALDNTFNVGSGADNTVYTCALQTDGRIVVGGSFGTFGGSVRPRMVRLNANGTVDSGFDPGAGGSADVKTCAIRSDGAVLIGGEFSAFGGVVGKYIMRLLANGQPDTGYNHGNGANDQVAAMEYLPDGKIVLGGSFTSYNGIMRVRLARLEPDGTLDTSFDPGDGASSIVRVIAAQPDGKILIGGAFSTYNGVTRSGIARVNIDGSLDAGFVPGTGAADVYDIAVQPDGRVIIVGSFTDRIARLNADGSLDGTFDPGGGAITQINAVDLAGDGKIVIGGTFQLYNSAIRNRVARLNADGSVDAGFTTGTGASHTVTDLAVLPGGKVLIVGIFTAYAGVARNGVALLNTNGTLDTGFNPGTTANGYPLACQIQPDGKVVLTGAFTSFNGTAMNNIVRLSANGAIDPFFQPGSAANLSISAVELDAEGRILIGGNFLAYDGNGRNRVARINGTSRAGIQLMLEGPYGGGMMNDALRTLPSFPLTEPFTAMGYAEGGYVSGATIGASVLSTTGNNAIVDWVIVEMRPVATPGTVAASRAVLLQRDGDVVDLDGVSNVGFAGLAPGNYCMAVKPRNHLPVMLSATTPVSYGSAVATVDFTLPATQVYDNDARKNVGGVMVLSAGDVTFNETVQYTGAGNDRDPILTRVGSTTPNNAVAGYWREDVNMDGMVKYTGSSNDRDIILTNVGSTTPNNTRVATLP